MKIPNVLKQFPASLLVVAALTTASFNAQAAIDMFLKIEGVDGEATDPDHSGWIEVLAFSEGLSSSGSLHVGGGGGAARVNVQDLSVTKYLDSTSPFIRQRIASGQHIPSARLVVRTGDAGNRRTVFQVFLENVLLTSVSAGASSGQDRVTENITINFAKIRWEYTPQNNQGGAGGVVEAGWDIQANERL